MIGELLDLFRSLAGERAKRREKTAGLLEHFSHELDKLAEQWSSIATLSVEDPLPSAKIHEHLRQQRSAYESVGSLISTLGGESGATGIAARVLPILSHAIGEKVQLYMHVLQLLGESVDFGEAKDYVPAQVIPDGVGKIEFIKRRLASQAKPVPLEADERERIIRLIRGSAEELSGLAGQFRSAVALFKAETPFI